MKKKIDGCELAREAITAQSKNKDRALTAGSLHRRNRTSKMTKDQISPRLCSMAEPPADMATWRVALRRERVLA
jgi:hypothetical protein